MEVTKIPKQKAQKPKIGVYVRVSTKREEQEDSFTFQSQYWNKRFENDSSIEYVGLFADEGISGKSMKNRKGLNSLLKKAKRGEIDKIYTKSISRFARNYTDLLTVVHELRDLGVPIIFEKENIDTLDPKCNLVLTIMSSLAEQELISMSQNQKWAARKRFAEGSIELSRILGYEYKKGKLTIIPEEAAIVRRIYELYLQGNGVEKISVILKDEGYLTVHGSTEWKKATLATILKNEKYTGNSLLQKNVYDLKVRKKNKGEAPQYYVENSHEAIISMEDFQKVQEMMREKAEKFHPNGLDYSIRKYPLSGKIKCGICGSRYKRKTAAKGTTYECIKWVCLVKEIKGKKTCDSHEIKNVVLEKLLTEAYNECLDKNFEYSGLAEEYKKLKSLLETERELKALHVKGYISDVKYKAESTKILDEIKTREQTIQTLQSNKMLEKQFTKSAVFTKDMADFLIQATVKDWKITFEFANGIKITKSYTNGRAGNVNGKLCKRKA